MSKNENIFILGISAYYHDSAAAVLKNGEIVAAAQEERFTRKKHDSAFPIHAIEYCLKEAGVDLSKVSVVTFYDKPLVKFERLLETYLSYAPSGVFSFITSMPVWLKEKLFLKATIKNELSKISKLKIKELPPLLFAEHHQSHAASAFFPSPFQKAAVLCLDGVGEWATTSVWHGHGNKLDPVWEINFPHSIGMLYSAFTYFTGFKVNSGEYKLMGLAPYGEPKYADLIKNKLIDLKDDGTFKLNMNYFNFANGLTMTNKNFDNLFGGPPRKSESQVTQREMDLAKSVQVVIEEVILKLAKSIRAELGVENICLAGGVALNCVANGRLLNEKIFSKIWIQPAAGDAGGALGAALATWFGHFKQERMMSGTKGVHDSMKGAYLGPRFNTDQIKQSLIKLGAVFEEFNQEELLKTTAKYLSEGHVVGYFQGRMEFGPRALGARSILGDPRSQNMQSTMNLKIKFRESFRPFAPAVRFENLQNYFEIEESSPYMLLTAGIKKTRRKDIESEDKKLFGIEKLKIQRSDIPAVTHVDFSARIQTVHKETNLQFWNLLREFESQTGCGVLVNTSFNVRGEPIVCTPKDAYRCFMRTEIDYLVIENLILDKKAQSPMHKDENWQREFSLD